LDLKAIIGFGFCVTFVIASGFGTGSTVIAGLLAVVFGTMMGVLLLERRTGFGALAVILGVEVGTGGGGARVGFTAATRSVTLGVVAKGCVFTLSCALANGTELGLVNGVSGNGSKRSTVACPLLADPPF